MNPILLFGGRTCVLQLLLHVLFAMHQANQQPPEQEEALSSLLPRNFHRRIFLIRHGETDWNEQGKLQGGLVDIALNANGKQQAARLVRELQNTGACFDIIVSSHLQRARQTADALALCSSPAANVGQREKKLQRQTLAGFREMDYGQHEGLPMKGPACTPKSKEIFRSYVDRMQGGNMDLKWPGGGESIRQVEQRAMQSLHQVLDSFDDEENTTASDRDAPKTIGIVAHAILNRVLLAATLRGNGKYFVDYEQDNCCINVIDQLSDGSFEGVVINYNQHMMAHAGKEK